MLYKASPPPDSMVGSTPLVWQKILGYIVIVLFVISFFLLPTAAVSLAVTLCYYPNVPFYLKILNTALLIIASVSYILAPREWKVFRTVGQFLYELLKFHHNLSEKEIQEYVKMGEKHRLIMGMHPHGIIPIHALLWASYCNQYLPELYGFGAVADVVTYLPIIRNILGYLTTGSATYKILFNGITQKNQNLFILPGGIAEIYESSVGRNHVIFNNRRGLIRLSLQTGALLIPTYMFGANDFFINYTQGEDGFISRLSRYLRVSLVLFGGYLGLPYFPFIPPKVTLVIGKPIQLTKKYAKNEVIPDEVIEALHDQYLKEIQRIYDEYKADAGYPGSELEIS